MDIERKTFNFEVKEIAEDGTFTGYASTFGNKDLDDDIVVKGAFAESIAQNHGEVPVLWQHQPENPVGGGKTAKEDDRGLLVTAKLTLGVQRAKEAYELMKDGVIKKMSIGYRVLDHEFKDGARYLKKLQLVEYSLVTFPANPLAAIVGVKNQGEQSTMRDLNRTLARRRALDDHQGRFKLIQQSHHELMTAIYNNDAVPLEQKKLLISEQMAAWVNAMSQWHSDNLDLTLYRGGPANLLHMPRR